MESIDFIKNILDFQKEVYFIPSKQQYYRNRIDIDISEINISDINSIYSIKIFIFVKYFLNVYLKSQIKKLRIKENQANESIIELLFDNQMTDIPPIKNILYYFSSNIGVRILNIRLSNKLFDRKFIFTKKELICEYYSQKIVLKLDCFSRTNLVISKYIYNFIIDNFDESYYFLGFGRDLEVPFHLLKKSHHNNILFTQSNIKCKIGNHPNLESNVCKRNHYHLKIPSLLNYSKNIYISSGRNGVGMDLIEKFNQMENINKIIIVSCNQNSLKNDVDLLKQKFILENIRIFDEHPKTNYFTTILIFIPK